MADCYLCKRTLNRLNQSWEHLIPSALGGSVKSRRLLCRSCNEETGRLYDSALVNYCRPFKQVDFKPDRINRKKIRKTAITVDQPCLLLVQEAVKKCCSNMFVWKFKYLPLPLVCYVEEVPVTKTKLQARQDVRHLIYLHAKPGSKILYGYVEFFETTGFKVQFEFTSTLPNINELLIQYPLTLTHRTGKLTDPLLISMLSSIHPLSGI